MRNVKRRRCRYIFGAATLVILVMTIAVIIHGVEEKEQVAEVKEAIQFDVYLWAKGKEKFIGTSGIYREGLGSTFGETVYANVFGNKVAVNDIEQFTYNGGIHLKFRYSKGIQRLNVYCHEISDTSMLSDDVRAACFVDRESGALYLVQVGDEFYEVVDERFFSDIKLLLRKEYAIE